MQKKSVIVTLIILAAAALIALLFAFGFSSPAEEPLPESVTVILDKDRSITATMGVGGSSDLAEEESAPATVPTSTPWPTATPTPWPTATPTPWPTASPSPTPSASPSPTPSPSPSPSPSPVPSPSPSPSAEPQPPAKCSYEVFYALSPEEKDAFLESFESYQAFYEWLIAAQAEFKQLHPDIEIGPGSSIDLSELQK